MHTFTFKYFSVIAALVLFSNVFYAQNCNNARVINCGRTVIGNTANESNNFNRTNLSTCYNTSSLFNGRDVMYEITIPEPGVRIDAFLTGLNADLDLFLFVCNNGQLTCAGTSGAFRSTNSGLSNELMVFRTTNPNTTIYVLVDASSDNVTSSYQLTVTSDKCTEPFSCNNAQSISCNSTYNLSTFNEENNFTYSDYGTCVDDISKQSNSYSARDGIYELMVSRSGELTVEITDLNDDMELFLFGDCSNGKLSQCLGVSTNSGEVDEQITLDVNSGKYYVVVDGYGPTEENDFKLRTSCVYNTNLCDIAEPISCNSVYSSTLIGESDKVSANAQSCENIFSYETSDKLYQLNVTQAGELEIELSGLSADLDLFLYSGCSGEQLTNCLQTSINGSVSNELITQTVTSATTYYVLVEGYSGGVSNFDLRISCVGAAIDCSDSQFLNCNNTYTFNTASAQNNFVLNDLSSACNEGIPSGNNPFTGNDMLFKLVADASATLTINMTGLSVDLDMFLYDDCSSGDLVSCRGRSTSSGANNETIVLENALGVYYLLVDGYNTSQVGSFNLSVQCEAENICAAAPILDCGGSLSLSTIGGDNNFAHSDYSGLCTERLDPQDNPFDAPDRLVRIDVPSAGVLEINMTGLSADLDLFLYRVCNGDALGSCIARSISFGARDEQIELQNASGTYYLVIDGFQASEQSAFNLNVNCVGEAPIYQPSICDFGGTFINNSRNLISNLLLDSEEESLTIGLDQASDFENDPLLSVLGSEACINSTFSNGIPEDYVFDSYIFYLSDDLADVGFGMTANGTDNIEMFVYTCDPYEGSPTQFNDGQEEYVPNCVAQSRNGSFSYTPPPGQNAGFYYVLVTGPIGTEYDLKLIPEGPCGDDYRTLEIGDVINDDLQDEDNDFFNSPNASDNFYSCYQGERPLGGEDVVYELNIQSTKTITLKLNSNENVFGLFLFDYLCGGECIDYAFGGNFSEFTQDAVVSATLTPGIYYVVVDKFAGSSEFAAYTLSVTDDTIYDVFLEITDCGDESLSHNFTYSDDIYQSRLGGRRITRNHIFGYYYPDGSGFGFSEANSNVRGSSTPLIPDNNVGGKCGFAQGDEIHVKVDDGFTIYDVAPSFRAGSNQTYTRNGTSVIDAVTQISYNPFVVVPGSLFFRNNVNSKRFNVMTHSEWEISGPSWIGFISDATPNLPPQNPLRGNCRASGGICSILAVPLNTTSVSRDGAIIVKEKEVDNQLFTVRRIRLFQSASPSPEPLTEVTNSDNTVNISPNPAAEYLDVRLPAGVSLKHLVLLDSYGRTQIEQKVFEDAEQIRLRMANLSAGVYLLKLKLGEQTITRKVVITR